MNISKICNDCARIRIRIGSGSGKTIRDRLNDYMPMSGFGMTQNDMINAEIIATLEDEGGCNACINHARNVRNSY